MWLKNKIRKFILSGVLNEIETLKNAVYLTLPEGGKITSAQWCSHVDNIILPNMNKRLDKIEKKQKSKK